MSTPRLRTAVLISGNGSNLQALIDAAAAPDFPAEIVLVISNVPGVRGLARAEAAGISTRVLPHGNYPSREVYDEAIHAVLEEAQIGLVCLAGFMRVLSTPFTQRWAGRMINIHPSLLPKYKGLHTHARAIEAGEREHGATVHWVTPELDAGEIILQRAIPIEPGDTPETLAERVHRVEHAIYPEALRQVANSLRT